MKPKTITVRDETFRVIRVPDPLMVNGERHAAIIDYEELVVWIDPNVACDSDVLARVKEQAAREIAAAQDE
jgi:hypothetical protein